MIPLKYNNFPDYIKDTLEFLRTYQWLYSTPNTHILSAKLLNNFPLEWRNSLNEITTNELNNIPFGYFNQSWPESLQTFIKKIETLKPNINYKIINYDFNLSKQFLTGVNPKKMHEIQALLPYIHENCKLFNSTIIIDIGTGLGYLPQLLHKIYGYKILGIEADATKVKTAKKRQIQLYNESINHIHYIHHFVDENSSEFLQNLVDEHYLNAENICLVGLHACADLPVILLKLFSVMTCVNQAIVMPCCYHRINKKIPPPNREDSGECFENFPVSCSLRNLYDSEQAYKFLTVAFLRLACQNTATRWRSMSQEDHRVHSIEAMRRAVLQLVADAEGYNLKRLKRKTRSSKTDNFDTYLNNLKTMHSVTNSQNQEMINSPEFQTKMNAAWQIYEQDCQLIETYTAFQTSLQNICENIILLDRIEMMKELGFESFARKVTDDSLSPRCYAIVARKPTHTQTSCLN